MRFGVRQWRMPCGVRYSILVEKRRLFFALWPDSETARRIWRMAADLVPDGKGRRLPPQHLHLTLAFLGMIDEAAQQCHIQAASQVHAESFDIALDQLGHFIQPQVVWLGTGQVSPVLLDLQKKLVSRLTEDCHYRPESRPFMPHMTVWRKVKRMTLPSVSMPITWRVSRFVLASSRTLATGAEYTVLQSWPLDR